MVREHELRDQRRKPGITDISKRSAKAAIRLLLYLNKSHIPVGCGWPNGHGKVVKLDFHYARAQ